MNLHYVETKSLTSNQFNEVLNLLNVCEQHDQVDIASSINVSMITKADEPHLHFILAYCEDILVGFIGLYTFVDVTKVEIAGMVLPSYRRRGIMTELINKGLVICKERNADEILFVCPTELEAAKQLMVKLGAAYSFSEFTMEYKKSSTEYVHTIELIKANEKDVPVLTELLLDGFGFGGDLENVAPLLKRNITQEGYNVYIAKLEGKPFATLAISDEGTSMYISAFTVSFEQRGKGYGKKILQEAVHLIQLQQNNKPIRLDVDVSNDNALSLYEAVGFQKVSGYDYYLNM